MDLVRSWLGQAFKATGAAVVAPLAIVLVLAVAALGGAGMGGLGSLGQVVAGPELPETAIELDDEGSEETDAVTQIASADPTGRDRRAGGREPDGVAPPGDARDPRSDRGDRPRDRRPPRGREPRRRPPRNGGPGDPGPEPREPGLVEGLGRDVQDAGPNTPLSPVLDEAINSLVETCAALGCP